MSLLLIFHKWGSQLRRTLFLIILSEMKFTYLLGKTLLLRILSFLMMILTTVSDSWLSADLTKTWVHISLSRKDKRPPLVMPNLGNLISKWARVMPRSSKMKTLKKKGRENREKVSLLWLDQDQTKNHMKKISKWRGKVVTKVVLAVSAMPSKREQKKELFRILLKKWVFGESSTMASK